MLYVIIWYNYLFQFVLFKFIKKIKMKKLSFKIAHKFMLLFALCMMQIMAFSQDTLTRSSSRKVNSKSNDSFLVEPWMWFVGGAVLLVILIALLRGNSSKEVSRTTIIKDDSL